MLDPAALAAVPERVFSLNRLWDAAAAHALWTDPDVRRYLWNDEVVTLDRVREVLAASTRDFAARRYGLWGVGRRGE